MQRSSSSEMLKNFALRCWLSLPSWGLGQGHLCLKAWSQGYIPGTQAMWVPQQGEQKLGVRLRRQSPIISQSAIPTNCAAFESSGKESQSLCLQEKPETWTIGTRATKWMILWDLRIYIRVSWGSKRPSLYRNFSSFLSWRDSALGTLALETQWVLLGILSLVPSLT